MHPSFILLVLITFFMVAALPMVSWLALGNRLHLKVMLWYGGLAGIAVACITVSLHGHANWVTSTSWVSGFVLFWLALRLEAKQTLPGWILLGAVVGYAALELSIDVAKLRQEWGVLLTMTALSALQVLLLKQLFMLIREQASNGLLLISLGVITALGVNVMRALLIIKEGRSPEIFSYEWETNAGIISVVVCSVLMNFGYLVFVLEKTHRRKLLETEQFTRMQAAHDLALQHSAQLQKLIRQRDEMVMANSRFSAMNSLSIFQAAVIHELSQPLQTLMSILDTLDMRVENGPEEVKKDVATALRVFGQLSSSLTSLRRLIAGKPPQLQPVSLLPALEEVSSIVETEARHRGIVFAFEIEPPPENCVVQADKILLQRIIFNLVTNAFEAHEQSLPAEQARFIKVRVGSRDVNGIPMASIRVDDNGPGFAQSLLAQVGHQCSTTKAEGIGMGLMLSHLILESWQGKLEIRNSPSAKGAEIEVLLKIYRKK